MSFNICRGTLGSLAMFTAIRNASSLVSSFATDVLLPRKSGSVRLGRTHKGQKAVTSF
jgi:hypothetical protein